MVQFVWLTAVTSRVVRGLPRKMLTGAHFGEIVPRAFEDGTDRFFASGFPSTPGR